MSDAVILAEHRRPAAGRSAKKKVRHDEEIEDSIPV